MREVFVDSRESLCALFAGHVELEITPSTPGRFRACPWRVRQADTALIHPNLFQRSFDAVGVRLQLLSNTATLAFDVDNQVPGRTPSEPQTQWVFDLHVDGKLHQRLTMPTGPTTLSFTGWSAGQHRFELYLYHIAPIQLLSVRIDDDAVADTWQDDRPRWLTYGSSITQCGQAAGPSETWPAIVANEWDLNHTNLGYGGNANLDPIIARMIADLPADAISLCFSVNNYGDSFSQRTWAAAIIGFILCVRDKKPNTPIVCSSPIWSDYRENEPCPGGMTLVQMRQNVKKAINALQSQGDAHLHYIDGISLFGSDHAKHMPDKIHPNQQGCQILAKNYSQLAMPWLAQEANWPQQTSQPV